MIKVVMIARSTLYTIKGGDTIQICETARCLVELGIRVDIKLTDQFIDYRSYDLLHFFNIIRPADILYHVKRSGKPFVLSPILVDYSEFDKHHRKGPAGLLFHFMNTDNIEYIKVVGRWLLGRDRLMSTTYLWKGQRKSIEGLLRRTEMLLPNSRSEYERLATRYPVKCGHAVVVNGIESRIFHPSNAIKKDPHLVICVARVEGIKNQLNLIRALNNTPFRLLIIGAPTPNQAGYYKMCRDEAAPNIRFIEHIPQKELPDYYQRAKVHVLPSWFETTGLSSLEAGAMGCTLVITAKGDTRSYFGDDAFYCDPASPESIYKAVVAAADKPEDTLLAEKINTHYTWQQAALQTLSAYQTIKTAAC